MSVSSADQVLIIPSYQPNPELLGLVRSLRSATEAPIIVVNDGSSQQQEVFDQISDEPGVTLLRHAVNLGKGAALKTAFNRALIDHPEAKGVLTVDADGQHTPEDVKKVKTAFEANPNSMVLGVRKFEGKVPFRSRFGNQMTRFVFQALTGKGLTDTQTGLRAIPKNLLKELMQIRSNRYEFETDMLIEAIQRRVPFREVPIRTVYIDNNESSHFDPLRDSLRIYFVFIRFALSSITTSIIDYSVFALARMFGASILGSLIVGRIVAGAFNFSVGKKLVFKSKGNTRREALRFVSLVIALMFVSNFLIQEMVKLFNMNVYVAKALSEGTLFIISFAVQRIMIFSPYESKD
ncbi:bifunctional glycosyltransferase family 2/GtrA family protein [bacterium]|nr:bifunctional glycosyltransferase family 2/GtrA family protein [bacterium]